MIYIPWSPSLGCPGSAPLLGGSLFSLSGKVDSEPFPEGSMELNFGKMVPEEARWVSGQQKAGNGGAPGQRAPIPLKLSTKHLPLPKP